MVSNDFRLRLSRVLASAAMVMVGCTAQEIREAQDARSCCAGLGLCTAVEFLEERYRELLPREDCEQQTLCVPTALQTGRPARCTVARAQSEGRCLPDCLPSVQAQRSLLARDGCGAQHSCVPCYDPFTGEPSGACGLGDDPGPEEAPTIFATCCQGLGHCVPTALVPAAQRASLTRDTCADAAELCAPDALTDPSFAPLRCSEVATGAEGRCLPECLPQVSSRKNFLAQGICPERQLCVPCFDPRSGLSTSACETPNDRGPSEPPLLFDRCCGSEGSASGLCVPAALLPEGAPELPKQTCTGADDVCAPRFLVDDPNAEFPACRTSTNAKGVCIEDCFLPSLARVVAGRSTCEAGRRCVACSLLGDVGGC